MYSPENNKIINNHKRKEIKSLFRKAFTNLSCLKLKNIRPQLEADFGREGLNFRILTFEKGGNNCSLDFYFWQDLKIVKANLEGLLKAIASDEFAQVKKYVGACCYH